MKDIDFDELDKAVGSVLQAGSTPATDTATAPIPTSDPVASAPPVAPKDTDVAAVPTSSPIADTLPDSLSGDTPSSLDASDETETTEPTPATPIVSTAKPSVSPARKRGQFLDMVHPSANMRKAPSSSSPLATRKTIAPLNTSITADEPVDSMADVMAPDRSQPVTTELAHPPIEAITVPEVPTETEAATGHVDDVDPTSDPSAWPDPLDVAADNADNKTSGPAATTDETAATEESAQTPFVADAKVEKRPLSAFAGNEESSVPSEESTPSEIDQPIAVDADVSAPEFDADLNSVESSSVTEPEATHEPAKADEQALEPIPAPAVEPASPAGSAVPVAAPGEAPAEPLVAPAPTAEAVTAPTVGASIQQQYKTPEPKKDDEAHPLFDTEEYHQPLLPDGKKKTKKTLAIVLLLVVLLAVGGVLGYFAYTMGI